MVGAHIDCVALWHIKENLFDSLLQREEEISTHFVYFTNSSYQSLHAAFGFLFIIALCYEPHSRAFRYSFRWVADEFRVFWMLRTWGLRSIRDLEKGFPVNKVTNTFSMQYIRNCIMATISAQL